MTDHGSKTECPVLVQASMDSGTRFYLTPSDRTLHAVRVKRHHERAVTPHRDQSAISSAMRHADQHILRGFIEIGSAIRDAIGDITCAASIDKRFTDTGAADGNFAIRPIADPSERRVANSTGELP